MDSSLQFARTPTGVVPTRCLSRSAERPRHYTATGVVPTGCLSESAERHGSADRGTTPPRVWCRRAASPDLRNATVLRTMALHRHGCGDDHDNGNDHDDEDHDDHDAMRHDRLGGSIDVSATGLRSATVRDNLHQPIPNEYYIFRYQNAQTNSDVIIINTLT